MNNWIIRQQIDLAQGAVEPRILPAALLMQGDKLAHEWRITVLQDGQPATLEGTVRGYFQRADGNYLPVAGTIDGHTAIVKLESPCYAIPGLLQCVMRLTDTSGNNTVTLGVLITTVGREPSGGVVDVEHTIPDIGQLLAQIEAMETGTAAATAAASAANAAANAATSATGQATGAAAAAQTAATEAGSAASAAQNAASGVVAATEDAQAAAQEASDAASDAVLAAGDADDAADAANAAAGAANAAASGANTAATAANTAASAATAAAGQATTAADNAATAAQAANAAATMIDGMTVETSVVPYGTTPQATITEVEGHKHVAIETQRGPQGPGYAIKGTAYATLAALQAAVLNPGEGDQYNVGTIAPYHVYRWTGAVWEDQGVLQGPKGDAGTTFQPAVSSNGVLSWENDGSLENPESVDLVAAVTEAIMPELQPKLLAFTDVPVLASSWGNTSETDTEQINGGYAVCATITLEGATADDYPVVTFGVTERDSGNYSGVVQSIAGGVMIYAKEAPAGTITIPTITLWP